LDVDAFELVKHIHSAFYACRCIMIIITAVCVLL